MTFQQAMAATSRELNARATITCVDAFVVSNTPVISFSVEEGGQVTLGSVTSSRYTLSLPNGGGEWLKNGSILGNRSLTGARVQIQIGVYHDGAWDWQNAGLFIVEKTSAPEYGTFIKLIGNDPIISLDRAYDDQLTYRSTTTLGDILTHIKSKGITITGSLACNASAIVNFQPDWGEEPTIRDVLGYVLQMGGSFARCDRAGNIMIAPANGSTTHAITTDKYIEFTDDERYFNFNRIKILPNGAKKDAAYVESYITAAAESAANTLCLEGNPLFKTKSTTTYSKATSWREGRRYYVRINNKYTYVENPVETSLSSYYVANTTRNTTNLQTMADGLKTALTGMSFRAITFRWRGDPTILIGDTVTITDTRGVATTTVILQQSMRFEGGFSSEISCPIDLTAVTPSTITSSGRVVPPYFGTGTIDGSVIMPESITGDLVVAGGITAEKIASKTVTADEIAAKTITADEIAAKTITANEIGASQITATHIGTNEIVANTANIKDGVITNAKIANGTIENAKIKDATIETAKIKDAAITTAKIGDAAITKAKIGEAAIGTAQIEDASVTSAKIQDAAIESAHIGVAGIDYAHIKDLLAGTAIIREGIGGKLIIDRLAVSDANIVNLTAGQLIVHGTSGALYQLTVDTEGNVITELRQIGNADVKDVSLNAGEKIIHGTITAELLNVQQIFAAEALIGAIKAHNIETQSISVNQINPQVFEIAAQSATGQQVVIELSNGAILDEENTSTVATLKVYHQGVDVTDNIPESAVRWERISSDTVGDATWNAAHIGMKSVTINAADIDFRGVLRCVHDDSALYTSPSYVDGDLILTGGDATDFSLADGDLLYTGALGYTVNGGYLTAGTVGGFSIDVQMSNLKTSYISLTRQGIEAYGSGFVRIGSGGDLSLLAGGNLNIKNLGNTANVINMDSTGLTLSSTGQLKLQSTDSIIVGGSPFSVGGTNLIPYSDTSKDILSYWSKWGGIPDLVKWDNDYIEFQEIAETASGIVSPPFYLSARSGDTLTLSFKAAHRDAAAILDYCYIIDPVNGNRSLSVLGAPSVTTVGTTSSPRYTMTFTLDATYNHNIQILIATNDRIAGHRIIIGWPQLEKGTIATDWSPSPKDPASGVKTSSVEVNTNGIYMDTTGTFNVNAGVGVNILGGTGATSIGVSNNKTVGADKYFLWAGNAAPESAPFSVKMDGSVKATKIQHEMPYTFWDMADGSTPAEFPVYIPSGYTIDSVEFTFQTKKARTFAKSASSTTVAYSTQASSSYVTGSASPTDPHSHSIGTHTHVIPSQSHGHSLNYGINEKSALATSCALKVGTTTIGTYSPDPSAPVEIKSSMAAGWNTVIVAPNDDARIVAFALVKLTPA